MGIDIHNLSYGNAYNYLNKIDHNDSTPNDGFVDTKEVIAGVLSGKITKEDCQKAGIEIADNEYPPQEAIELYKKIEQHKVEIGVEQQRLKEEENKNGFWRAAKPAVTAGLTAGIASRLLGFKKAGLIGLGIGAAVGLWAHLQGDHRENLIKETDIKCAQQDYENAKAEYNTKYGMKYPHKFI